MEETGSHRRDHCNGTHGTEGGTQIFKTPVHLLQKEACLLMSEKPPKKW